MTDFDAAAAGYDEVATSDLGRELRRRVHEVVDGFVSPRTEVLDLGAGTGIDAERYASRGARVVAVERSVALAALARERLGPAGTVEVADVTAVDLHDQTFDLITSNFGVVNCIDDLDALGARLAAWCRPGGHLVLVVMGRWVPWEAAGGIRHLDRVRATRRLHGRDGDVRYLRPRDLSSVLGSFELQSVSALGLVLPTYQQRAAVQGRPRLLRALAALDKRVARPFGRLGAGDHWLGVWRRA